MSRPATNMHGKKVSTEDKCNQCRGSYKTYQDGSRVSNVCKDCRSKVKIKGEG